MINHSRHTCGGCCCCCCCCWWCSF